MKLSWFKGLDNDQHDELRGNYLSSLVIRKRLTAILKNKVDEHFKAQQNRDNFSKPNWAFEQADAMGYCRALNEVISLISEQKQEVNEKNPVGRPRKYITNPEPIV